MKKYLLAGILVSSPLIILGVLFLRPYFLYQEYNSLISKGQRSLAGDQSFQALAAYTEAVKLQPSRPLAYIERSRAHMARSEQADAMRDLKAAIDLKPDNPGPYLALGDMYLQSHDYFLAATQYEKTFALGLVRAPLFYKYAYVMFQSSKFDAAVEYSRKALEKNPDMGEASALLGMVYLAKGDSAQAEAPLRKAISQLPVKERPYEELGSMLYDLGRYKEGLEVYQSTVEAKGKSSGLYSRIAKCMLALGNRDGAIQQLGLATQLDDKQPFAYIDLARIWIRTLDEQNDPNAADKALAALDQAEALAPSNSEVQFLYGRVYEIRKDYRRALEYYTRSSRLWPVVPEAYEQLAAVSIQLNERPNAEKYLQKAAVLKAKSPAVFSFYGRFFIQAKRYKEAAEKLSIAVALNPKNVSYYLLLADAQRLAGNKVDARGTLERALAVEPQNGDVLAAQRRLGT